MYEVDTIKHQNKVITEVLVFVTFIIKFDYTQYINSLTYFMSLVSF